MSTVEVETGTYIKRFAFWNPATWGIPKLYWDAISQEQRLHAICRQLEKVIAYADYIGVNVDDIAARLKAIEEGQIDPIIVQAVEDWFEEHQADITQRITALDDALPISDFSAENTVSDALNGINGKIGSGFDSEHTVKDAFDAVNLNIADANADIDDLAVSVFENAPRTNYLKPSYIGSFTKYSGMHKIKNSADTDPIYTEAFCMINDTTMKFFTVNKTDTVTHVDTAILGTNELQFNPTNRVGWGHCNQVCYNPDNQRYYLNIGSDLVPQQLYSTMVLNSSFDEVTRFEAPNGVNYFSAMLYDKVTHNMYWVGGTDIYSFDPATNEFQKLDYTLSELPSYGATLQGAALYNNYLVMPVTSTDDGSYASALKVYNILNGKLVFTFSLSIDNGFYPIGEVEDCDFDSEGNLYITSIVSYDTSDRYFSETVVSKCDIFNGTINAYHQYYSTQPQNIYVECVNYNKFRSTGSDNYPCKTLEEASLIAATLPKIRKIMLGGENNYSTPNTNQTWFGWLWLTGVMTTVHFQGNGVITIRGGIKVKDNAIIKLRNRATFLPAYNMTNAVLVQIDDSILLASGIIASADANALSTYTAVVSGAGSGMYMGSYVSNDIGATNAVSNFNGGFGYVLGNVKSGTW